MKRAALSTALVAAGTGLCLASCALAAAAAGQVSPTDSPALAAAVEGAADEVDLRLNLSDRLADLKIDREGNVLVRAPDGVERAVDAQTFARLVDARQREARSRSPVLQFFDVTGYLGLIWVAVGFVGQLVFMGRMLVQWLASEKQKRSVVPTAFWWMSLIGGSMVLAYFIWRRDPVGIFGQAMGWVIYARNLWLIHRPSAPAALPVTSYSTGAGDPG